VGFQLHTSAALYSENEGTVPLKLDTGWVPGPVWAFWIRENSLNLRGIERRFFCLAACGLITIPTDISWLLRNKVVTCQLLSVTINCSFYISI